MANAFLRGDVIAAVALERLRRELVLPRLVSRMGLADFKGAKNDTVNVRIPVVVTARDYEFRTRTAPIVLDEITETSIPVKLDKHPYSAIAVTDEELTLDIHSFSDQVLAPQIIGVAEKLEGYVGAAMTAATTYFKPDTHLLTYTELASGAEPRFYRALVDARKRLNDAKVPTTGRVCLVGSGIEAAALKEDAFRKVNESGSSDALRAASIGNVAGFEVYATQSLATNIAIAMHRSAFVFANVAPVVPSGVPFGESVSEAGLALRWIRDYDPNYLRDRSVVSSFAGAVAVADGPIMDVDPGAGVNMQPTIIRAVKITGTLI